MATNPNYQTRQQHAHQKNRGHTQRNTKNNQNTPTTHNINYNYIQQNITTRRRNGGIHTIPAHSNTPYRARRDALEVMWGVHVHRCRRKHGPSLTCTKCHSPLTNTHILGGCRFTANLRTQRHNNMFKLLHQLLQEADGGRWPIVGMDLGQKPVTHFKNLSTP